MVTGADAESWRQALAEDGWSRHLTTLDGWRKFTAAGSRPPELPDARRWAAMAEAEQELFGEYRLDYHTRLAAAATSTLRQVVTTGRRLTLLNRHAISARRGMILSGAAGTGKTTAITQFGKTHRGHRPAPPPRDQRPHPGHLRHRPAGRDPADARCRVRPVPRPAADCPGEHHRRDRGRLRRRGRCPGQRRLRRRDPQPPARHPQRRRGIGHLKVLLRAHPRHVRLRRHRRRAQGLFSGTRGSQIAGRFTLIPTPVPARRRMAGPGRHARRRAAPAPSPARHPGRRCTSTCTTAPAG